MSATRHHQPNPPRFVPISRVYGIPSDEPLLVSGRPYVADANGTIRRVASKEALRVAYRLARKHVRDIRKAAR